VQIAFGVLVVSVAGVLTVFVFYPLGAFLASRVAPRPWKRSETQLPSVTLVIAVRNAAEIIGEKLRNIAELDYPDDKLDVVFFVDGSDDNTADLIRQHGCERMHLYEDPEHRGKIAALNSAVPHATGEILMFSDTDAILSPGAVRTMVRHFADERIGGVCGLRVIHRDRSDLRVAQERYIRFDSALKTFESAVRSVASNDGKLFCIRRELFRPVIEAVTDDFYLCLTVVEQGFRFVFEPEARARVRIPSRNPRHEIQRRRRIVSPSLRAIVAKRRLANPFRYGPFAFALVFNRFARRMLPLFLLGSLVSSTALSVVSPVACAFCLAQVVFYCGAFSYPALHPLTRRLRALDKLHSMAFYFAVGSVGTFVGILDFVRGRKVTRWTPKKTDSD
jgi:cellulose synthase/poly-beta-1,6-N-acetylglucosamine synthase-like glycosyltransferase